MSQAAPLRTDEQLVAEFRSGNDAAFSGLVARYKDALTNLAYRVTGAPADEVVRDFFLCLRTSRRRCDQKHPFYIWAYRSVLHGCRRVRPRPRPKTEPRTPVEAVALVSELTAAGAEVQAPTVDEQMQWALERVPRRLRASLVLHDIHGMRPDELGRVLRRSPRAVERRLAASAGRLLREVRAGTALLSSAPRQEPEGAADDLRRVRSLLRGLEWKTAPWHFEAGLLQAILLWQDRRLSWRRRLLYLGVALILLALAVVLMLRVGGRLPAF